MSEQVEEQGRDPAPLLDLFATAVHRFGSAWADLVAAALALLVLGSVPILIADSVGTSTAGIFAVALMSYTTSEAPLRARFAAIGRPMFPSPMNPTM